MSPARAARLLPFAAASLLLGASMRAPARADEPSNSPYIDSLKRDMKPKEEQPESYIDSVKKKLPPSPGGSESNGPQGSESYTEQLKKELGAPPSQGYSDQLKSRVGPEQGEGAIEALKAGRSELRARMVGEIHSAAGFRVGATMNRAITAASGLQSFESIYKDNFPIDLSAFYEYQPWHSEWFGNFGFFGEAEVAYFHGPGAFQFQPHNADGSGNIVGSSATTFSFFSVPLTIGVDYRFNLLRLFRPFVRAGLTFVALYEDRNDGGVAHSTDSRGVSVGGGVNILMDWLSKAASWDLYAEHGVKHYYLTLDYSRIQSFSGDVQYTVSGFSAGFTFEF